RGSPSPTRRICGRGGIALDQNGLGRRAHWRHSISERTIVRRFGKDRPFSRGVDSATRYACQKSCPDDAARITNRAQRVSSPTVDYRLAFDRLRQTGASTLTPLALGVYVQPLDFMYSRGGVCKAPEVRGNVCSSLKSIQLAQTSPGGGQEQSRQ